jgi:hypothetical protein
MYRPRTRRRPRDRKTPDRGRERGGGRARADKAFSRALHDRDPAFRYENGGG